MMTALCPQHGAAASLKLAIIGMRAEANDAELSVVRRHFDAFDTRSCSTLGGDDGKLEPDEQRERGF
jgi:hypothetical protein